MIRNAKLTSTGIQIATKYDCPYMPYRTNSTMYVKGDTMAIALAQAGSVARGMKIPLMNKIGNRKKFINVIASKTSLTIADAIRPNRENVSAPRSKAIAKIKGFASCIPRRKTRPQLRSSELPIPKAAALAILPRIMVR